MRFFDELAGLFLCVALLAVGPKQFFAWLSRRFLLEWPREKLSVGLVGVCLFGFRSFSFQRRQENWQNVIVGLEGLIVLFRVGLPQFFRSWAFEVPCWAFAVFVGAMVTRNNFYGARALKFFCFALGLRNFVSKLHFQDFLVGLIIFVVERWQREHVLRSSRCWC